MSIAKFNRKPEEYTKIPNEHYKKAWELWDELEHEDVTDEDGNTQEMTTIVPITSIWMNNSSQYGDGRSSAVALGGDYNGEWALNLSSTMNDIVAKILASPSTMREITKGHAGIRVYTYTNRHGIQHGVEFVDI